MAKSAAAPAASAPTTIHIDNKISVEPTQAPLPPSPNVVQMPPLSFRAEVAPKTIDDEARTVELIFTTGTAVRGYDYWTGREYIETLSLDPANVRLDRLNEGAPLLDSHSAWSVADQLGAVAPASVSLTRGPGPCKSAAAGARRSSSSS